MQMIRIVVLVFAWTAMLHQASTEIEVPIRFWLALISILSLAEMWEVFSEEARK